MIVIRNTKELEEQYDLSKIPDNEQIRVLGGLEGKNKYNAKRYEQRTTYPAWQLKQIINVMRSIESGINPQWTQLQKAKYTYNVLGKHIYYNHDASTYNNEQSSNLTGLLSRKSICAGFSLIYKETMDRQGIPCEYVRGKGGAEKHAWNVLRIDGNDIPVDLTWDRKPLKAGQSTEWFANQDFYQAHTPDLDEPSFKKCNITPDYVNMIDQSILRKAVNPQVSNQANSNNLGEKPRTQEEILKRKEEIFKRGLKITYDKFVNMKGKEAAYDNLINSITKFVNQSDINVFTRDNSARLLVSMNDIKSDDVVRMLSRNFAKEAQTKDTAWAYYSKDPEEILAYSTKFTTNKHSLNWSEGALIKYISNRDPSGFTRDYNARKQVVENCSSYEALRILAISYAKNELGIGKNTNRDEATIIYEEALSSEHQSNSFSSEDINKSINEVTPKNPTWKQRIQKAIEFIKSRTKNLSLSNDKKSKSKDDFDER